MMRTNVLCNLGMNKYICSRDECRHSCEFVKGMSLVTCVNLCKDYVLCNPSMYTCTHMRNECHHLCEFVKGMRLVTCVDMCGE